MRKRRKCLLFLLICLFTLFLSQSVSVSAKTVKITVKAKNKSDITSTLQKQLNKAAASKKNKYRITVKPGTYKISATLRIYSNTTLYLDGVTFKRTVDGQVMLRFGGSQSYTGYNQCQNVQISGGTWNGSGKTGDLMRLGHGKNITLKNVTFTNVKNSHHVEIAACKNVKFTGCTFKNYKGQKTGHVEALQIDIMRQEHFNYYPAYDETPCVNVTVKNCTFTNLHCGVGTHSAVLGSYHKNISITNNSFSGTYGYAVVAMNYKNSKISNNTITDCGYGIEFKTLSSSACYVPASGTIKTVQNLNTEISGNTISLKQTGFNQRISAIRIYGAQYTSANGGIPAGNYKISGMTIKDNVIVQNCKGVPIVLIGTDKSTVSNNSITCNFVKKGKTTGGGLGCGICLQNSSNNNTVTGNRLTNNKSAAYGGSVIGIRVYLSSSGNTVYGNTVENFYKGTSIISGNTEYQNTVTGR